MQCKRCLLDICIDNVKETETGCEQCDRYTSRLQHLSMIDKVSEQKKIVDKILQKKSKKSVYDCVIGISGGADSSFLAHWAKEKGLSALLVHVDNGWNSELSTKNIENIVNKTGFPLKTIVLNWDVFKKIQIAFITSGLKELEYPTDHFIKFGVYQVAKKYGIKSILSGRNLVTEGILPESWSYGPLDNRFLKDVLKRNSVQFTKEFPTMSLIQYLFDRGSNAYHEYFPLNYLSSNGTEWKSILKDNYDWQSYEQKHFESVWTKFYQGYWLPKKFGIDKRRAHLSVQFLRGEITKEEAMEQLNHDYLSVDYETEELGYVLSKLDLTIEDINNINPVYGVDNYKNHKWFFDFLHSGFYIKVRKYILT